MASSLPPDAGDPDVSAGPMAQPPGPDATSTPAPTTGAFDIRFSGGRQARAIHATPRRTAANLLGALGLAVPRPVILVIGAADSLDPAVAGELTALIQFGALRAAAAANAIVVDGGTNAGVMAAVGEASQASDVDVELLGVAPSGAVTWPGDERQTRGSTELEPNHTWFILANTDEWGGETALLFDALDALRHWQPAVAIVAGGGPVTIAEARLAASEGIPLIVIQGTGGVADDLAAVLADARRRTPDELKAVLAATDVASLPLTADPVDLERLVSRKLGVDATLVDAWQRQKKVSAAANRQQWEYRIGQSWLILLGLFLTFVVISKAALDAVGLATLYPGIEQALTFVIIILPITTTVLTSASGKFRPGNRWVLLRGTSEGVKREIFRYRTRTGIYAPDQTRRVSASVKLSEAIGSAMGALMRTEANALDLGASRWSLPWGRSLRFWRARPNPETTPPDPDPTPYLPLTPSDYVTARIDPQIGWYTRKVAELDRQGRWLRWLTWIFAGIGTLLAAVGFQIWVAVTTAIVGVYATLIEAFQIETSEALYNQAATDLAAIRTWWNALSPMDQRRQQYATRLVDQAEQIMRAEHVGWVQEMQDAMTQLRLEQATGQQARGSAGSGGGGGGSSGPDGSGDGTREDDDGT